MELDLTKDGQPDPALAARPLWPLKQLQQATSGLGPTYLSKVLHFALPWVYGAIDTRLVRVFGLGDSEVSHDHWLDLKARDDGYGWYIAKQQAAWPDEYATWIDILRFLAQLLSDAGIACPHPDGFIRAGLRTPGQWECADVETALFGFASQRLARWTKTACRA